MATTIIQKGFNFVYRETVPGQPAIVQTWSIERVAAFIFLIDYHRQRSQKYMKWVTQVAKTGAIQYELGEFDRATNRDINRLTKLLLPYCEAGIDAIFMVNFPRALDNAEKILKEKVSSLEEPREIMGKLYTPERWFKRPTAEEYAEIQEKEVAELRKLIGDDSRIVYVLFYEEGLLPCRVVRETGSCMWVDAYQDGKLVYENRRLTKATTQVFD